MVGGKFVTKLVPKVGAIASTVRTVGRLNNYKDDLLSSGNVDSLIEKSAGVVNHHYVNMLLNSNVNPFAASAKVYEFRTVVETRFVRVHSASNAIGGRYFTFPNEIDGMSPLEIQQHLGLPEIPTHVQEVIVPSGATIHMGRIRSQPTWGVLEDGGVQMAFPDFVPDTIFRNSEPIL